MQFRVLGLSNAACGHEQHAQTLFGYMFSPQVVYMSDLTTIRYAHTLFWWSTWPEQSYVFCMFVCFTNKTCCWYTHDAGMILQGWSHFNPEHCGNISLQAVGSATPLQKNNCELLLRRNPVCAAVTHCSTADLSCRGVTVSVGMMCKTYSGRSPKITARGVTQSSPWNFVEHKEHKRIVWAHTQRDVPPSTSLQSVAESPNFQE